MSETEWRNRSVLLIEKALEEYDRIILIDRRLEDSELLGAFYEEDNFKGADKKILILTEWADKKAGSVQWRCMTEEEIEDILEIYYMYEFSSRITIVAQNRTFGGLLDYVAAGLLTREEMIETLLE